MLAAIAMAAALPVYAKWVEPPVKVYPGATYDKDATVELLRGADADLAWAYRTEDPFGKVCAFYRAELRARLLAESNAPGLCLLSIENVALRIRGRDDGSARIHVLAKKGSVRKKAPAPPKKPAPEAPPEAKEDRELMPEGLSAQERCYYLYEHLTRCRAFDCAEPHPQIKDKTIERRILGRDGQRCRYQESLPAGGMLDCRLTQAVADKLAGHARGLREFGPAANKTETTTQYGDLVVENVDPLATGECVESRR